MSNAAAKQNNVVEVVSPGRQLTPLEMVDRAVQAGATPETLEKLMALQERWEAGEARKAFDEAMAAAKTITLSSSREDSNTEQGE